MPRKETKPGPRHVRAGVDADVGLCGVRGGAGLGIYYSATPPQGTCLGCVAIRDDPERIARRDRRWRLTVAGMRKVGRHPFNRLIR